MTKMEIGALLEAQREYFATGATLEVDFRIRQLKKLYEGLAAREADFARALKTDLGKSATEGYLCEIGMVLAEISHLLANIKKYAAARRVPSPLAQFPSRSLVQPVPYGTTLIMSPWNYPLLLTLEPLADAIAAGNTAVVKPSAYAPATAAVLKELLEDLYPRAYVAAVTGGRAENTALLEQRFDFVFFTGSQAVGREVLRHTAEHLTPAVLELGGKSPCIVDETADIPLAARRIVFGKFLNCGQTCVAPDYVLCHESVRAEFIRQVGREIVRQFGEDPLQNPDYGKIISQKHFDRVLGLVDPEKVVFGGQSQPEACRLAPTVMDGVTWEDPVMGQEIFGPVLPVLGYTDLDALVAHQKTLDRPLALYLFSTDKKRIRRVIRELRYGGGCINDVVVHLATSEMGFGGVGESGMGSYHGKAGFDAFSHQKSVLHKKNWLDLPMRYQPYQKKYEKLLRKFLK